MIPRPLSWVWDAVTSLKLTIVCLAALMVLVVACTLAQVDLGTWGAVDLYIRSFFVWSRVPGTEWSIATFPGGATVGLVLAVNLVAAQLRRMELSWRKAGLWISHAGLILLVLGEFVTGVFQVETQMAIQEGETVDFVESPRQLELAILDVTDPAHDDVYGVPQDLLEREGAIAIPGTPLTVRVHRWYTNSRIVSARQGDVVPATAGLGTGLAVIEEPPVARDDLVNLAAAYVEPVAGAASQGVWLVSNGLGQAQQFQAGDRTYQMLIRARREYLPYSLTLKDFRHDVYAGTNIPKNFSSLVRLDNPQHRESRDVLIYMNQPLRYEGKAFYQASFGRGDTLSILQVVQNPGWLLPYVSCVLVMLGLLVHFGITLRRSTRRRQAAIAQSAGAPALEA